MKKEFSAEEALKNFDYVCCGEDGEITEFSVFANILAEDNVHEEGRVTFQCFQKFGAFYTGEKTFSRSLFDMYYRPTSEIKALRKGECSNE